MRAWQIYHDGHSLQLNWSKDRNAESVPVQRICSLSATQLLLLTADECLFIAELSADGLTLSLILEQQQVVDVDYCANLKQLFVVTHAGAVLSCQCVKNDSEQLEFVTGWNTLSFDPLELSEDGIRVRRVCCSKYGAIFVTYSNEFYVLGSCGDIFATEATQPKHTRLYDERAVDEVLELLAGEEFFLLLLRVAYDEKTDPLGLNGQTDAAVGGAAAGAVAGAAAAPATSSALFQTGLNKRQLMPEMLDTQSQRQQNTQLPIPGSNTSLHSFSDSSTQASQASYEFESSINITQKLLRHGYALLYTQVYSFGAQNNGLLGTGDHIKRATINHIKKLDAAAVVSIAAGSEHSLARTLDGRVYHWGSNSRQQLQQDEQLQDISSPTEFDFNGSGSNELNNEQRRILSACCGDYNTVLLNVQNELITQQQKQQQLTNGKLTSSSTHNFKLQQLMAMQLSMRREFPLLLASGDFTVHNQIQLRQQYQATYILLQSHLKQLIKSLSMLQLLQRPHQRKSGTVPYHQTTIKQLQPIYGAFRRLICLTAVAVKSFESFYRGELESPADLIFIKHHRECIALFEEYMRANCDVYSVDGYADASKILTHYANVIQACEKQQQYQQQQQHQQQQQQQQQQPQQQQQHQQPQHQQPQQQSTQRIPTSMYDLGSIFQQPLQIVNVFLQFLDQLTKSQPEYSEHLLAWQSYARQNTIDLELAENTQEFWKHNERNTKIRHFRRRHRRVILTSTAVPLKLSPHGLSISTPTFILFSDCFCQMGSQLQTYPLVTMWVKIESDVALRIITPEKSFVLTARSHLDKMLWYDQFESSISAALGLTPRSKMASIRTTTYVFSSAHPKYADVHAYGRWRNGVLHGNCYLEYPDGRIYFGEIRNSEIEGYGKMIIPSVGFYEGTFKAGKFHGHGTYEKDNDVYEGNFRDGMFHGHGLQRNNQYTYVGEYQNNAKSGYGVLDDMLSGDKYMGMFADNKRVGAGTCITMTGDYFEGIFNIDELAGVGIAVLENDYYYEGELCMSGPSGKGTYYMPSGIAENEDSGISDDDDISNRVFVGNILSGQLGGNWQEVRVISGTVAINRHFPKYPKSIGELVVDANRKWRSLFENFEEQVFGATPFNVATTSAQTTAAAASNATKIFWNRIAVFMTAQREREKAAEQQQDVLNETKHSYFAHNISMGFANMSLDRLSMKSSTSLLSERTAFDFRSSSCRYIKIETSPKRSHSQDTLYDDPSFDLNDSDSFQLPHQQPHQHYGEDLHSLSGFSNPQLANWANDTMNGVSGGSSSGIGLGIGVRSGSFGNSYVDGIVASTPSLRSSRDSVFNLNGSFNSSLNTTNCSQNSLDFVPNFGINSLTEEDVDAIKAYLLQAFKDRHHPLYLLNQRVANCFYISYGCWKVKPTPILAKQAMHEWDVISKQIYKFVRKLFPALPEDYCIIESTREVISHITLLYPIVLTEGIYSTLFVLYANKYSRKDELYRLNLIYAEKLDDQALAKQLGLDDTALLDVVNTTVFTEAIQTLKQLQEKYSPKAMLSVIEQCMQLITDAPKMLKNAQTVIMAADSMMPLTLFLVLRAAVPHLGAELALLDDLTGGDNFQFEMNGIAGYCYTTLKAAYEHITAKPLHNNATSC